MRGSGASGRAPDQCKSHLYPMPRTNAAMQQVFIIIRERCGQAGPVLWAPVYLKNEFRVWHLTP